MNCDLFTKQLKKGRETIVRTNYKKQCGGTDRHSPVRIYVQP